MCEYFPAGNVVGDNNQYFKDNVKKQTKGKSTDTVETGVTGLGVRNGRVVMGGVLLAAAGVGVLLC